MTSRVHKGRAKEQLVKTKLKALGYEVTRSAASKGAFDLIAYKPEEKPLFIQIKSFEIPIHKIGKVAAKKLHQEFLATPPFKYAIKVFIIIDKEDNRLNYYCYFMGSDGQIAHNHKFLNGV